MAYVLIALTALGVSALTLYSGFGLGTLLLPAFALYFPLDVAVGATAIVHLADNLFKVTLVGKHAEKPVVLWFLIPGIIATLFGAWLLTVIGQLQPITRYRLFGSEVEVSVIGCIIGLLMIAFAIFELLPKYADFEFPKSALPVGGLLSGFFGGLSGHQGALRAAFLSRSGLSATAYIGTAAVCSVGIDVTRLVMYALRMRATSWQDVLARGGGSLVLTGVLACIIGAFVGKQFLGKVTLPWLKKLVGGLLLLSGLLMAVGIL